MECRWSGGRAGSTHRCASGWREPTWCRRWWACAASSGYRVYFFGAAPTVAESAAVVLRERFPGAEIVADAGPMFADPADMDPAALVPIKAARPDICCIALGNPKQELWIDRFGADVGAPVVIGVGGTLDFVSGTKRRAPRLGAAIRPRVGPPRRHRTAPADPAVREGSDRLRASAGATDVGDVARARRRGGVHDVVLTTGVATVRLVVRRDARRTRMARRRDGGGRDLNRRRPRRMRPSRRPRHRHSRRDRPDRGSLGRRHRARSRGSIDARQLVSARLEYLLDQPIRGRADRSSG